MRKRRALYSISSCKGSVEFAPLELQTIHYTFAHVPGLGDITSKQLQLAPSVAPSVEKQAGRVNKACTNHQSLASNFAKYECESDAENLAKPIMRASFACICMCACECVYVSVCVCACTCVLVCLCVYMYMCSHMCMYVSGHVHVYVCVRACVHKRAHL